MTSPRRRPPRRSSSGKSRSRRASCAAAALDFDLELVANATSTGSRRAVVVVGEHPDVPGVALVGRIQLHHQGPFDRTGDALGPLGQPPNQLAAELGRRLERRAVEMTQGRLGDVGLGLDLGRRGGHLELARHRRSTIASVRSPMAASVNLVLSCSRAPAIAAPGTAAASAASRSGIDDRRHPACSRNVPWSAEAGSLRRRLACTSCGTTRPCATSSTAIDCGLPHPGDRRPDPIVVGGVAQRDEPPEGARHLGGEGRDPAAAGDLHRGALVPGDRAPPSSVLTRSRTSSWFFAAEVVTRRPRDDATVGARQLELHGADERFRLGLRAPWGHDLERGEFVLARGAGQRGQLCVDPETLFVQSHSAHGRVPRPSRCGGRTRAPPRPDRATARGCRPRRRGWLRVVGSRRASRARRDGLAPDRRTGTVAAQPGLRYR